MSGFNICVAGSGIFRLPIESALGQPLPDCLVCRDYLVISTIECCSIRNIVYSPFTLGCDDLKIMTGLSGGSVLRILWTDLGNVVLGALHCVESPSLMVNIRLRGHESSRSKLSEAANSVQRGLGQVVSPTPDQLNCDSSGSDAPKPEELSSGPHTRNYSSKRVSKAFNNNSGPSDGQY